MKIVNMFLALFLINLVAGIESENANENTTTNTEEIIPTDIINEVKTEAEQAVLFETTLVRKIYEQMQFENKDEIDRSEFREFFHKLITRENPNPNHLQFYSGVADKYVQSMPYNIKTSELNKYLEYDKFVNVIEDVIREQYGEEYVSVVREALIKSFNIKLRPDKDDL